MLGSKVGYSYHSDFKVAALLDGSTMVGYHCFLLIDVYDVLCISYQRDFAHLVSRRVVTIPWIAFPYKPDRYSQITLRQVQKAAITRHNEDIKIANPYICNASINLCCYRILLYIIQQVDRNIDVKNYLFTKSTIARNATFV